jgi:hypothetical protein
MTGGVSENDTAGLAEIFSITKKNYFFQQDNKVRLLNLQLLQHHY